MAQDAVVIEHGFRPDDHKLHELSLQLLVDLSVPAFFIGVSPTGMDAAIPKQHVSLQALPFFCCHQKLLAHACIWFQQTLCTR